MKPVYIVSSARLRAEAVDPERGDEAARRRREGVRRDEEAEVPRIDLEQPHELRRERHHDHEVEDVRELHAASVSSSSELARLATPSRTGEAPAAATSGGDEVDNGLSDIGK